MRVDAWVRSVGVFTAGMTAVGLLAAGAPAVARAPSPADAPTYLRVSVKTGGGQPAPIKVGTSNYLNFDDASVSDDGRFTVFSSNANDLVPGDTNTAWDVFLRDNVNDVTTRISVSSSGQEGTTSTGPGLNSAFSGNPSMSADGRYVVFESHAPNLVPGDTNDAQDIFLRDTAAGVTTRVSLTADGEQNSQGGKDAAISPDGRFVVFESYGSLVAGDAEHDPNVYLRELATGRTVRINESYDRQPVRFPSSGYSYYDHLAVTSGGHHVLFSSRAENLVPGDTNGQYDIFVRDVAAGTTVRASVTDSEGQLRYSYAASMSADGRYVAFDSETEDLKPGAYFREDRVYVSDLIEKTTTLVSVRDDGSPMDGSYPSISPDGRRVAFTVYSGSPLNIFLHDLDTRTTRLVTVSPTGEALDQDSWGPAFSANGRHLTFESEASNLVDGDTNGSQDIFVRLNVL